MMQKNADLIFQNNRFLVTGDLHFSNVMPVYQKSLASLEACPEWVFDFSELQSSDSSGLALIVEWVKLARKKNKKIHFEHLSTDIMSIAKAAGLDGIFNGKA